MTRAGATALRHAERAMSAELDAVLAESANRDVVLEGLSVFGQMMRDHHLARR